MVDGTDALAVYREAKRAIEKAREGGGPTLIENQTLRMEGHAVHDDAFYVPKELFERWAERDPIERYRTWLLTNTDLTSDEEDEITGHGFRAMARTILDEVLQVRPAFIEHQLAHAVRDPNGRAYNRTAHLAERRRMMTVWADYLDKLKADVKVLPFKQAEAS